MTPLQNKLLSQFKQFGIRYLIVGGQAMRALGVHRQTRDLDVWIARDLANAEALTCLMHQFQNVPPLEQLNQPNFKFTVGDPACPEVDILTSVAGDLPFDVAYARSQRLMLDGRRVPVVTMADLLAIKEASAKKMEQDAADQAFIDAERTLAASTGAKERRDITLLQVAITAVR